MITKMFINLGESETIEASERAFESIEFDSKMNYLEAKNMAFTNFLVVNGYGQGVVVSTGNQSHMSAITKPLPQRRNLSSSHSNPIDRGLDQLAYATIFLSTISTSIYLIVWATWIRPNYNVSTRYVIWNVLNIMVTGLPVGLPVVLIAGLFLVLQKLRRFDIVIKNIFAITSMSGIDVVLTDKTGTLTRNTLEVDGVFYSNKEIDVDLCSQYSEVFLGARAALNELLELCDFCCSNDDADETTQAQNQNNKHGNLIERTLSQFAEKNMKRRLKEDYECIDEILFNSTNKYQVRLIKKKRRDENYINCERESTVNLRANSEETSKMVAETSSSQSSSCSYVLMIRGAPDFLIPKCRFLLNADGGCAVLNDEHRRMIEAKMEQWSLMGRRLICFCKKTYTDESLGNIVTSSSKTMESHGASPQEVNYNGEFQKWFKSQSTDLIFVGMIGFIDPPKPE